MIKLATSLDGIKRTTGLVAASSNYTCMFLADLIGFSGPQTLFFARNSANAAQYIKITRHSSLRLRIDVGGTIGEASSGEDRIPVWTWYRRSGNTHELYDNGELIASASVDISGWTLDEIYVGTDTTSGNWKAGNYQSFREWSSALTTAQLRAEVASATPVITTGLTCDSPLASDYLDDSANGSDWTAIGTPSFFTQGEHLDLAQPSIDRTITVSELNSNNRIIYWHVSAADRFIGYNVQRVGSDFPTLGIYEYTHSNLYRRDQWVCGWMKVEVDKINTFVLDDGGGGTGVTSDFTLHFEHAPDFPATIPSNSIIVNDEQDSTPGDTMPSTAWTRTGTFLGFTTAIPPGEIGASIPSGYSLWHDRFQRSGSPLLLVAPDFSHVSAFDLPSPDNFGSGTGEPYPRITHDGTNFYVLNATTQKLYKVTTAGVVTGPVATITTLNTAEKRNKAAIAMSRYGTILYYTLGNAEGAIKRWDLNTNAAMSDLYVVSGFVVGTDRMARATNTLPGDIVVLDDNSVVTWWFDAGTPQLQKTLHVAPEGVLIDSLTYSSATAGPDGFNHMGPSGVSGCVTGWFVEAFDEQDSKFVGGLRLSDGNEAHSWTAHLMNGGYQEVLGSERFFQPSEGGWMFVYKPTANSGPHAHASWH